MLTLRTWWLSSQCYPRNEVLIGSDYILRSRGIEHLPTLVWSRGAKSIFMIQPRVWHFAAVKKTFCDNSQLLFDFKRRKSAFRKFSCLAFQLARGLRYTADVSATIWKDRNWVYLLGKPSLKDFLMIDAKALLDLPPDVLCLALDVRSFCLL